MDRSTFFYWFNVSSKSVLGIGLALAYSASFVASAQEVPPPVESKLNSAQTSGTDSNLDRSPSDSNAPQLATELKPGEADSTEALPDRPGTPDAASEKLPVIASAEDPASREIQNIALQARSKLDASTLPSVAPAQAKLKEAISHLERFLATNASSLAAWNEFLRLDEIRAEVAKEKPDTNILVDLEMNMRQNYLGLELQPFTNVRDGLTDLVRAIRYGTTPDQTIKVLDARLEKLVEALNEPLTDADSSRAESVGIITTYLHESRQVPWAVDAMRANFSQPNLQVYVPELFLNRMLGRPVAQPSPVNECLLGTRIVGNAFLNGAVTADLLPSFDGVSLCLNLNAHMTSNTVGYNRGVVLTSIGSSPIHAAKAVHISSNGISAQPASVATQLQSQITSIQHKLRIVRKIATKKAAETQPQANRIAEGRLQDRVRTQFDQQVETQLAESRMRLASFQQQPRPEIQRIGLSRPTHAFNSTSEAVYGTLTHSAPSQLAASSPSPLPRNASDFVIDAHQSALMNAVDTVLGGRTLRNADMDDLVRQFGMQVTDELAEESKSQAWSITFATFHPVQIEFNDGLVKFTLRISQMTRGDQSLKQPATIAASYRPTYAEGFLRLDREGPVDIDFVGRPTGLASVSMRAFLKGKFEDFFKPELVNTHIDFGQRFPGVSNLQISSINLDNGWLQVGVR